MKNQQDKREKLETNFFFFFVKSYFFNDEAQLFSILQTLYNTLKRLNNTKKNVSGKRKCLTGKIRVTPTTINNSSLHQLNCTRIQIFV